MENIAGLATEDDQLELPPGFRFHPTDEELITHYLSLKVLDKSFYAIAIGEVDLNKVEPWDLPWKAKMGEKEWYFFCVRDRKYPTGLRTNRATVAGYWKATGKDKEIFRGKTLVGMKKTLVFYKGRAPKGEKTNWVMHEYRLEGKFSMKNLPQTAKNEWVISRIFRKSSGGKKTHISGLVRMSDYSNELEPSNLPPLKDLSPHNGQTRTAVAETSHVSCFSNSMVDQKPHGDIASSSSSKPSDISNTPFLFSERSGLSSFFTPQFVPHIETLQFPDSFLMHDQSILRVLMENNGTNLKQNCKSEFSNDTDMSTDIGSGLSRHEMAQRPYEGEEYPITTSAGPVDLDCLWNY
ncbi:unnamed protein product [Ilex paraguariensis]|uniref:NAC domain-containing protein n=1 Tax=Ilex paraguariensis TaxID=185542 RepID=A0ABC8UZK3_9AQUA